MSVIGYNPDLQSVLFRPSDKPLHITPGAIWATSQGPKPETPVPSIEIGREFTNEDGTGRGYLGELKGVEYVFAATETFYNPILGSDNDYVIIINYNVKHLCDCIAREYKFGWQTGAGIYADQLESIENVSYTNNIGPEKLDLTPFTRLTKISNSFDSNVPYKKIVIPGNVTDVYNCFSNYEREAGVTIDTLEVLPGESPVDLYSSFGDRGYVNHLNLHRTSNFLSYPVKNLTVFGEVKSFYYNGCDILEEAEFKDGVETISSLSGHPVLRKITLPSTLKEIGTFYNCPKLTELTLPEGLEKIGDYAFKGTGIHNLSIPNSVTALDDMTLSGMEFLNDVSFGKDLTSISWFNWEACPSLRVIRCASLKPAALTQSDNPENFYDDAFYKSVSVACPTAAYQAYSEAMGWRKFFYGKKSISLTTNYKSEYVVYFRNYMKFRSSAASPENLIPVADASTMGLGEGEPVTLVFKIPENASLKKVTLNDKDITSQIVDGEYTIARLDADSRLDVEIADSASGIDNITQDGEYTDGLFDVYSLSGTCLMRKADRQAVESLYPGIYIINGKKVIIRK